MYKLKTSRSINKRFKLTSTGKLLRHRTSKNHLLEKKRTNRKRRLGKIIVVNNKDVSNFKLKLPYI